MCRRMINQRNGIEAKEHEEIVEKYMEPTETGWLGVLQAKVETEKKITCPPYKGSGRFD